MRIKKVTIIAEKISKPAYFCGLFIFMQRCYLCIPQESTCDIEIVMCVFSKLRPSLRAYKEYMIMHLLSYWICNVCVYTVIENQKSIHVYLNDTKCVTLHSNLVYISTFDISSTWWWGTSPFTMSRSSRKVFYC